MDVHDTPISEARASSWLLDKSKGNIGDSSLSATTARKKSLFENSVSNTLTDENQLKNLSAKKQNDRSCIQVQDQIVPPVKRIRRLALPEEEMGFKFGTAPKPLSYNIRRPDSTTTAVNVNKTSERFNTKISNNYLREKASDNRIKGNRDNAISQPIREEIFLDPPLIEQHYTKNYSPNVREISIKKYDLLSNSHIQIYQNFNQKEEPDSILLTQAKCTENIEDKNIQSGTYKIAKFISYPSLTEDVSEKSSIKNETELLPRLPSKLPIEHPFSKENQTQKILTNNGPIKNLNLASISKHEPTKTSIEKIEEKYMIGSDINQKESQEISIGHHEMKSGYIQASDPNSVQSHPNYHLDNTLSPQINFDHPNSKKHQQNYSKSLRVEDSLQDDADIEGVGDSSHMLSMIFRAQNSERPNSNLTYPQCVNSKGKIEPACSEIPQTVKSGNDIAMLSSCSEIKVIKAQKKQTEINNTKLQGPTKNTASVATCKKIFESCRILVDMAKECEDKTEIIEKQKTQLMSLESSNNLFKQKTKQWKAELAMSKQKSELLSNMYKKFQVIISELIESQYCIKQQGNEISKRFSLIEALPKSLVSEISELKNECKAATASFKNLHEGLKIVNKDIDESKRDLVDKNKQLTDSNTKSLLRYQAAEIEKRELLSRNIKLESENKTLNLSLNGFKTHNQELETSKINMNEKLRILDFEERENLFQKIKLEEKLKELISSSNNEKRRILDELNHERTIREKIEKEFECQRKNNNELLALVEQTPKKIALELNRDDYLIARIFNSTTTTQEMVERTVNEQRANEKERAEVYAKIFKDISSRIEVNFKKQENLKLSLKPMEDILKDLHEGLIRLRDSKAAQERQDATILSLQASNKMLIEEGAKLTDGKAHIESELNELKSKLRVCEESLHSKTVQFKEAEALRKENSQLAARILNLESEKEKISKDYEDFKQEILKLKEKSRDECDSKDYRITELQNLLSNTELKIKNFEDEKSNYVVKELENKKNFQDLIKKAESSKATLKLKLDTKVKNLEQRIKHQSEELENLRNELNVSKTESDEARIKYQKLQTENEANVDATALLHTELGSFKDQFVRQAERLQMLENNSLEPQTHDLEGRLQSVLKEVSELRSLFQDIKIDNFRLLNSFSSDRKNIERLNSLYDKHREDGLIGVEDISLQESLEMLEASLVDPEFIDIDQIDADITGMNEVSANQEEQIVKTSSKVRETSKHKDIPKLEPDKTCAKLDDTYLTSLSQHEPVELDQFCLSQEFNEKCERNCKLRRQKNGLYSTDSPQMSRKPRSNIHTPLSKEKFKISTPAIDINFQDISHSSSPTKLEANAEVHAPKSDLGEPSQEYDEALEFTNTNDSLISTNSRLNLPRHDQMIKLGGLKRNLHHDSCDEISPKKPLQDLTEQVEPIFKRQKSISKVQQSVQGISETNSDLSRPYRSSLRNRNGRDTSQNSSNSCRKTNLTIGRRVSNHLIDQRSPRVEPTESNVKQRRHELKSCVLKGDDAKIGAKFKALASPHSKIMQVSNAKFTDIAALSSNVNVTSEH
ncbi:hypothetical protein EV44_g3139 [Erysiphe necator]|uniref:Uncharacterized protein n=1 Tax=Uncinula necator TaxID=52586 RepID=A0A0B1P5Y0_UNCNE|nr:hypothetical protein EV44_g3139 [Erysiphe necator]